MFQADDQGLRPLIQGRIIAYTDQKVNWIVERIVKSMQGIIQAMFSAVGRPADLSAHMARQKDRY